jgi:glycosyltransferase involved in cell wall biosynthesis
MSAKRVLSVSHSYVVGLNRALPNALARLGWDVTVAAPAFFPGDLRPITLEFDAAEPARVAPVALHAARRTHVMTWGRDLRRLLDDDWDIVHAWEEPYIPAGAQIARWRVRGRLVFASFQNIAKRYPPPFNWIERYSMARADAWIAFGVTVERALATRRGFAGKPHRVIPPGLDLERFAPDAPARETVRDELGFSPRDRVIGFAGRFVPEKGLSTLTAALDRARPDWKALFVGGGPLEGELRRWAVGHPQRVRVITGATHARMPRYLNAMDVLALPSHTTPRWREQFGRVLVEAMACGVAVIGSDSGEIPHVIGAAGVVLPERDADAWARGIDALLADPERRRQNAERGLARARDFSAEAAAAAHAAFFEELLQTA